MDDDWIRYDSVAQQYECWVVPNGYDRVASDLVDAMAVRPGEWALDIGCGSGAAMDCLRARLGDGGRLVGLDVSLPMLALAVRKGHCNAVAAAVPDIPFRARTFDLATASLVLSHFADVAQALRAIAATLRPGGRLGVSVWADVAGENEVLGGPGPYSTWRALVDERVGAADLRRARSAALPAEAWLASRQHVIQAMTDAGLTAVDVGESQHPVPLTIRDFVAVAQTMVAGRYVRHVLGERAWGAFLDRAIEVLSERCGKRVVLTYRVLLAVGRRETADTGTRDKARG